MWKDLWIPESSCYQFPGGGMYGPSHANLLELELCLAKYSNVCPSRSNLNWRKSWLLSFPVTTSLYWLTTSPSNVLNVPSTSASLRKFWSYKILAKSSKILIVNDYLVNRNSRNFNPNIHHCCCISTGKLFHTQPLA